MNRLALTAFALIVSASGAWADDRPQIAAAGDATVASGSFYLRAGASYQSIDLPRVDLGEKLLIPIGPGGGLGNANGGAIATFKPTATGYGLNGAIGYFLPPGSLSPAFGARPRVELDVSGMHGTDNQSSSTMLFPNFFSFQHVDGTLVFFGFCSTQPCPTTTTLRSRFEAFDVGGKAASDFGMGPLTLTPSLALFLGQARNEQTLSQSISLINNVSRTLFETASETGTDRIGARLGLNGKYDLTPWLAIGLGGNVGFADRQISLKAYDNSNFTSVGTATAHREVAAFLAGGEASLVAQASANISVKLFGGVRYDSDIPGITAQNYSGVLFSINPVTPVSVKTAGEIGYFVGLSATVKFGP